MPTEEEKQAHLTATISKINDQLEAMAISYDSKVLAAALLMKSSALLRGLLSVGVCSEQEIMNMFQFSFAEAITPLPADKRPQIAPIDLTQQKIS